MLLMNIFNKSYSRHVSRSHWLGPCLWDKAWMVTGGSTVCRRNTFKARRHLNTFKTGLGPQHQRHLWWSSPGSGRGTGIWGKGEGCLTPYRAQGTPCNKGSGHPQRQECWCWDVTLDKFSAQEHSQQHFSVMKLELSRLTTNSRLDK